MPSYRSASFSVIVLWRPLQHLAEISTIFGPRSGLMDGTENLNGNLPSLSEILEGNCKKSQAYENCCKPVWKMRNPQWKPRQSKGTLETNRKQTGRQTAKNPKHATQTSRPNCKRPAMETCTKTETCAEKPSGLQKMEKKVRALERLTADTEIVTKSALRTESSIRPNIANVETLQHENL